MSNNPSLESCNALVLYNIYPEVHGFLKEPGFWSGSGKHINLETAINNRLTVGERCLTGLQSANGLVLESTLSGIAVAVKLVRLRTNSQRFSCAERVDKLENVSHQHLVKVLGSFSDRDRQIGFIMYPVGICNLSSLLEEIDAVQGSAVWGSDKLLRLSRELDIVKVEDTPDLHVLSKWLRRLYGCTVNALLFLHSQEMIHGELKPEHIVLCPSGPCIIGFGSLGQERTDGISEDIFKYYAPELDTAIDSRMVPSKQSDVFSLGCCFLEIATVVRNRPLHELRQLCKSKYMDNYERPAYKHNLDEVGAWMRQLRAVQNSHQDRLQYTDIDLIELMLRRDPQLRPNMENVRFYLDVMEGTTSNSSGQSYHGSCCRTERFLKGNIRSLETQAANRLPTSIISTSPKAPGKPPGVVPSTQKPLSSRSKSSSSLGEPPVPKFHCPFLNCDATFKHTKDFYDHLNNTHSFYLSKAYNFRCPDCRYSNNATMTFDALRTHLVSRHTAANQSLLLNRSVSRVLQSADPSRWGGHWKEMNDTGQITRK